MGVNEKVLVQVGAPHVHNPITLYLEHETTNTLLSDRKTVVLTDEKDVRTVDLMVRGPTHSEFTS